MAIQILLNSISPKFKDKIWLASPGSRCGADGRAVASDTRDLRFKCGCVLPKDENNEKEVGNGPFFNLPSP